MIPLFNLHRILADDRLSSSSCNEMPIVKRSLIDLPENYTDLLNKAITYECPNWSVDRKSKSFAICLICGDLVCYEVSRAKWEVNCYLLFFHLISLQHAVHIQLKFGLILDTKYVCIHVRLYVLKLFFSFNVSVILLQRRSWWLESWRLHNSF